MGVELQSAKISVRIGGQPGKPYLVILGIPGYYILERKDEDHGGTTLGIGLTASEAATVARKLQTALMRLGEIGG